MAVPRVLVIAGSDCSGGAGLEADQKVLAAHGCYAMTATTALTAQNTLGIQDVYVTPPPFVAKQINSCLDDIKADVVKIGMLASAETVSVVAETLKAHAVPVIVLDPVIVATSGAQLLPGDAVQLLRERLLPITTILTPNLPEAALLLREAGIHFKAPEDLEGAKSLAKKVHNLGAKAVLLKGGHMPLTKAYKRPNEHEGPSLIVDILYDGNEFTFIESKYLKSRNTHGTGCSLASAIAANLASSQTMTTAVRNACRYVEAAITKSRDLGSGNGPINHFHSLQTLPFTPGQFFEYLLDRPDLKHVWKAFTQHEFLHKIGNGTLRKEAFKHFLVQDYLYLVNFARMAALSAYKSKTIDAISASSHFVLHIQQEMVLHLEYCKEFGLSQADVEGEKESLANVAYSRWLLDIGQSEDWIALQMALASCQIGYGVAAKLLQADVETKRVGNLYYKWIESYAGDDYQEASRNMSDLIEKNIIKQSPSRVEELIKIFIRATELEIEFWEMGLHER